MLRYPNGDERRIRYPLPPSEDLRSEDLTDGCWADSCWEPRAQWLGLAGGAGGDVQARAAAATAAVPQQAPAPGGFLPQPAEVREARAAPCMWKGAPLLLAAVWHADGSGPALHAPAPL